MSVEYFSIEPLNRSTNSQYSYDSGTPLIQFQIGDVEKYLLGQSVRLSFDFKIKKSGLIDTTSGTQATISQSCGLQSIIQQLDLSSFKTNTMLESCRNYNRCMSTLIGSGFNDELELCDNGTNQGYAQNQQYVSQSVGTMGTNGNKTLENYTIPLYSGLLQGTEVYLGQSGIKGMVISINLAPSSDVLQRLTDGDTSLYEYSLSNVRLIGKYYNPTDEEFRAKRIKSRFMDSYSDMVMRENGKSPSVDELNTAWSELSNMNLPNAPPYSYYSLSGYVESLNSSLSTHNMNLGLSKVRSVFMNFIPSSFINNLDEDGMSGRNIVDSGNNIMPIVNYKVSRNGVIFPNRFDITSNAENSMNADQTTTNDRRASMYQSLINAIKPMYENHYSSGSYKNAIDSQLQFYGGSTSDKLVSKTAGLGVNFSNLSDNGVDFSFSPLQFEIQTRLKNNSPATSPVHHTIYVFAINQNTLVFDNNSVRVIT